MLGPRKELRDPRKPMKLLGTLATDNFPRALIKDEVFVAEAALGPLKELRAPRKEASPALLGALNPDKPLRTCINFFVFSTLGPVGPLKEARTLEIALMSETALELTPLRLESSLIALVAAVKEFVTDPLRRSAACFILSKLLTTRIAPASAAVGSISRRYVEIANSP